MDSIFRYYTKIKEFSSSVIEWRSTGTAPYLMTVNTFFWLSVFYLNQENQLRLLISLAAVVFGWDVLLTPSHEHSIIVHVISWPIKNTLRTASVAMSLLSAQYLRQTELEKACWLAYATVGLLIINPVWHYQRVPNRIFNFLFICFNTIKNLTVRFIVRPLIAVLKVIKYIVLLKWIPVLFHYIKLAFCHTGRALLNLWYSIVAVPIRVCISCKQCLLATCSAIKNWIFNISYAAKCWTFSKISAIKNFVCNGICTIGRCIKNWIILPIKRGFLAVGRFLRYWFCAHWWPGLKAWLIQNIGKPLIRAVTAIGRFLKYWFCAYWWPDLKACLAQGIGTPLKKTTFAVGRFLRYWLCAHWWPGLKVWLKHNIGFPLQRAMWAVGGFLRYWLCAYWWPGLKHWLSEHIGKPLNEAWLATKHFLHYWLCAEWWPGLKGWVIERYGRRIRRTFNYFCFGLVYVFCGYWVKPLGRLLAKLITRLYGITKEQLENFGQYIYRTAVIPFGRWAKARMNDLVILIKRMLHKLGIAIRDSVFWPLCLMLADLLKQIYGYFRTTVLQPIFNYIYEKYKTGEDYVIINFLAPVCKTIIDNIPERSPFCDDSDTELIGLLPDGIEDDEADATDNDAASERPSQPSRSATPLTEDEHDFLRGLKFPTIEASESSDEEFDFELRPTRIRGRPKAQKTEKTKTVPKDPAPSLDPVSSQKRTRSSTGGSQSDASTSHSSTNLGGNPDPQNDEVQNQQVEELQRLHETEQDVNNDREDVIQEEELLPEAQIQITPSKELLPEAQEQVAPSKELLPETQIQVALSKELPPEAQIQQVAPSNSSDGKPDSLHRSIELRKSSDPLPVSSTASDTSNITKARSSSPISKSSTSANNRQPSKVDVDDQFELLDLKR